MSAEKSEEVDYTIGVVVSKMDQDKFEKNPHFFKPGNQLWKQSLIASRKNFKVKSPEDLIQKCCDYFQWLEDNPYGEARVGLHEGRPVEYSVDKMRMPTLQGLCAWLGLTREAWGSWRRGRDRPELNPVVMWAENVMHDWKLTAGGAGLVNTQIVMRDLGLVEKHQVEGKTTVIIDGDEAKL